MASGYSYGDMKMIVSTSQIIYWNKVEQILEKHVASSMVILTGHRNISIQLLQHPKSNMKHHKNPRETGAQKYRKGIIGEFLRRQATAPCWSHQKLTCPGGGRGWYGEAEDWRVPGRWLSMSIPAAKAKLVSKSSP